MCVCSFTGLASNLGSGGTLFFEHFWVRFFSNMFGFRVRFFRTCSGFGYVLRGVFRFRVSVGVSKKKIPTFDGVYLLLTA